MGVYLRRLLLDSVLSFGGRGSSSYKSRAAICRVVRRGRGGGWEGAVSLTRPALESVRSFVGWEDCFKPYTVIYLIGREEGIIC